MRAIVVGVGNPVRRDDSVGLAVAREVRERLAGREGVEVAEIWAGGLRLAEAVAGFECAVIVDAMVSGNHAPGTVVRVEMEELCALRAVNCQHDTTLPDALEMLRRAGERMPETIVVIGIEAADADTLDERLTPAVEAAVPVAAEAVLNALGSNR